MSKDDIWVLEDLIVDPDVKVEMLWVDIETTGLSVRDDAILEIGMVATDRYGLERAFFRALILEDETLEKLKNAPEIVREMHDKSGLERELGILASRGRSQVEKRTIEAHACDWLAEMGLKPKQFPMSGSSVQFDHAFLDEQMPYLSGWFTHRNMDTSTLREACKLLNPRVYEKRMEALHGQQAKHRVLDDIRASINEYQFYIDNFVYHGGY